MHRILEILEETVETIHVLTAKEIAHRLQVDAAGEMLCVVMHDQAAHPARLDLVQRVCEYLHRIGIECVCLAVELDQRDAVEIIPTRHGTTVTRLQGLAFFTEADNTLRTFNRPPGPTAVPCLQVAVAHPVKAGARGFGQELRYGHGVGLETSDKVVHTDFIDQLEGALDPVVTEFHRVVDPNRVVADFRYQRGRVTQRA